MGFLHSDRTYLKALCKRVTNIQLSFIRYVSNLNLFLKGGALKLLWRTETFLKTFFFFFFKVKLRAYHPLKSSQLTN